MLSTGSVKVRADCIKLDVSEDVLLANADVRTRFLEKTSPMQRVRDAKIVFEEPVEDSFVTAKPISFFPGVSRREVSRRTMLLWKSMCKFLTAIKFYTRAFYRRMCQRSALIGISEAIQD